MDMRSEQRAFDKIYRRRDRYEIPDWQREEVWGAEKKRRLIDSILRGWKLPKFYFLKTSENPDEFDVVDGQQVKSLEAVGVKCLRGALSLRQARLLGPSSFRSTSMPRSSGRSSLARA